MNLPLHLFAAWGTLERRIRSRKSLALFTDFDGTLVPIRRRPEDVRLAQPVRDSLARISRRGALVGVVSGRRLADVQRRVGLGHIWYTGAHGFFLRDPRNRTFTLLNGIERTRISLSRRALARELRGIPGIRIEPKVATLAIHHRAAAPRARGRAWCLLSRWLARNPGVVCLHGKRIWEIFPSRRVDKWTAVAFILRRERLRSPSRRATLFYLGDDSTDERVFRKLRAFTVVVGKRRRTAARYYLRSPAEVHRFLERWAEVAS